MNKDTSKIINYMIFALAITLLLFTLAHKKLMENENPNVQKPKSNFKVENWQKIIYPNATLSKLQGKWQWQYQSPLISNVSAESIIQNWQNLNIIDIEENSKTKVFEFEIIIYMNKANSLLKLGVSSNEKYLFVFDLKYNQRYKLNKNDFGKLFPSEVTNN